MLTPEEKDLVAYIVEACAGAGISVSLPAKQNMLCDGQLVSGWFDDEARQLVAAACNPHFSLNIAHEFCHFRQWADRTACKRVDEAYRDYLKWMEGGAKFTIRRARNATRILQQYELDCEKRAIALLADFRVEYEADRHLRGVSAYLFAYAVMTDVGKPTTKTVYENAEVLACAPPVLLDDYMHPPKTLVEAILRNCF